MKTLVAVVLLCSSFSVFGQKEVVEAKLNEYGLEKDFLNNSLRDQDAVHYYEFKITTNDGTKNIVQEGYFDPRVPVGQRWVLKTVNGAAPTKKELKKFNKAHNTRQPDINGEVDDNSWTIAKDTDTIFAIDFRFKRESLPKKYAFLADCTGTAYISKETGHLTTAEFRNDKPLKVKIFNVTTLAMDVDYTYLEEEEMYVMEKEYLDMKVKLLGQLVEIEEISEYANHEKVK